MPQTSSDYYERTFDTDEIDEALTLYLEWCKQNAQEPEVRELDEIDETNIDHVLYHAEIQGFIISSIQEDEM